MLKDDHLVRFFMKIYEFTDYKEYLNALILSMPKKGRGQFLNISKELRVHSTLISQIIRGEKHFTQEQAFAITKYFSLSELETEYFLEVYQLNRAGTFELIKYYESKVEKIRKKFEEVSSRVKVKKSLNESDLALYYSDWSYAACWLLCGIDEIRKRTDLADKLKLSLKKINDICDFLVRVGLIIDDGNLSMGQSRIHIGREHPLVSKHHINWRLKSLEYMDKVKSTDLAFTAPLSISKKEFSKVKEILLTSIESVSDIVSESDADAIAFLNIDFIEI